MKSNFKTFLNAAFTLGIACTLTACDENSWNNHLDGFEEKEEQPITDAQTVEYTLTDTEYATIAGLAANKTLAGTDGADALAKVGTLKRFSADAPASKYVPAFLESTSFPYFTLTDGSAVKMTYKVAQEEPQEYLDAQNPQSFTVTKDMYQNDVWGSEIGRAHV